MTTVIYDVISGITAGWNESVIELPTILEGVEKYSTNIRERMPHGGGNTVYVTNTKAEPRFVDPKKTVKDVVYHVNLEIVSSTGAYRDNMFDEVYRIVEATGITGYENRNIENYIHKNQFSYFTAELNFNMIMYNETVAR